MRVKKTLFGLFAAAASQLNAGVGDVGTTSASFLKLGSGARPAALGEAYVALADDSAGLVYNPAGMSQLLNGEVAFTHTEWFRGLRFENLNAVFSLGDGGMVGTTLNFLTVPEITRTREIPGQSDPALSFEQIGSFTPFDMMGAAHYARPLSRSLAGGASLKAIGQSIDNKTTFGVALDLGMFYHSPWPWLKAGLAVQNLGTPIQLRREAFGLPINIRMGAAARFVEDKLLLLLETDYQLDASYVISTGLEYNFADKFFPRFGFKFNEVLAQEAAWSAGFGIKRNDYGFDFSVVPFGELGLTYRGTLHYTFGRPGVSISTRFPYLSTTEGGSAAVISTSVGGRDKVASWGMYVYQSGKNPVVVHRQTGQGPPPKEFMWDGKLDNNSTAPEGTYYAVFSARYTTGNTHNSKYLEINVNNSPPKISVKLHENSRNPLKTYEAYLPMTFVPVSLDGKEVASWKMEVLDSAGVIFRTLSGEGAPPAEVVWDGKGDDGSALISGQIYQLRYRVRDPLGNTAVNGAPLAFKAVFR